MWRDRKVYIPEYDKESKLIDVLLISLVVALLLIFGFIVFVFFFADLEFYFWLFDLLKSIFGGGS